MVCRNCQKSVLDPNIKSTVVSDCGCTEHTASDDADLLVGEEAKMSRRVDSNRAMVVSYNGKSIMAIVDRLIQYTRCMIRNLITHVIDLDNRVERLEGNGGELTPIYLELDVGYMYSWKLYRIGNTVFVNSNQRQLAESQADPSWIDIPSKIPEGFRPITNTQIFGYSQTKLGTIVQREIGIEGNIRYMCLNGIPANQYVITPATSWLTSDPYPTNEN